jgi:HSP20 family protein
MTRIKVKKIEDTKATFKDKIADVLEEMWDKIGQHHHGFYATAGRLSKPDTDLSATEDDLTYRVELPGVDDDDVEVEINRNRLRIRGEKRDEKEEVGDGFVFRERRYGSFERNFILPEGVKQKKVKADFSKGVLTVTVPYTPRDKGETIRVPINQD